MMYHSLSVIAQRTPLMAGVLALLTSLELHAQNVETPSTDALPEVEILGTAKDAWKQALGVSTITDEDLQEQPSNDLATILRKQPGVNLTGNSTSGQRGNNRQIDLRGMGPENTLILIDGRPVNSRSSVRYGWRGERDTRGDINWVPADAIERIEVLRGPSAARYGNGAAGGVINIITKSIPEKLSSSATAYYSLPEDSRDGDARRATFGLAGPLSEQLGFRLNANIAKTDADAWDINRGYASTRKGPFKGTFPAGREGVRNRDISTRLSLKPNAQHTLDLDLAFSRQGNIYAGDTQNTNNFTVDANGNLIPASQRVKDALGSETNRMYRTTYALTHKGYYDFGTSTAYVQYERTRNSRLEEGLAGGSEGLFSSDNFATAKLETLTAHGEMNFRGHWGSRNHVMTVGAEYVDQKLNDPSSMKQDTSEAGDVPGISGKDRKTSTSARIASIFVEDNIELTSATILTPGLRLDHHSTVGSSWSPSANLSHYLSDHITLKAGIARAYKSPNLYQTNPNYLLYSRGIGCWGAGGACYLQGNPDLKAETSINKELGIEYSGDTLLASLTYFHNNYRDKVEAGLEPTGQTNGGKGKFANADIFRWSNIPKALVSGLEGTFNYKLTPALKWSTNFTYMLDSKNKTTGQQLSIIPKYTINSRLDWRSNRQWNVFSTITFYGRQKPNTLDYQGLPMKGEETQTVAPYALVGVGAVYHFGSDMAFTAGVTNLFDKRLYRKGNAVGVNNPRTIYGAGAATYNEPGRAFYVSFNARF